MAGYRHISEELIKYLKLRTLPVGFKFFEDEADMKELANRRKLPNRLKTCQMITLARVNGWTIGATVNDFSDKDLSNHFCTAYLGMGPKMDQVADGTTRSLVWFRDKKDGLKCETMMPCIPAEKFKAIGIAPLAGEKFEPDVVLLYGTPAQIIILVNAIQWENYEQLVFHCVGESACNDSIVRCYLTKKPQLALPCFGERQFAAVQEEELVMGLPPDMLEKIIEGLKGLYSRGIRYPIPSLAPQSDPSTVMPEEYRQAAQAVAQTLKKSTSNSE